MGIKEKELMNSTWKEDNAKGRMFRSNSGVAYQGKITFQDKIKKIITLVKYRYFHGMPEGFPDQVGWESKTICQIIKEKDDCFPCMQEGLNNNEDCEQCKLNHKIAIFKARETKTGKLQLSKEQRDFRDKLLKDGGIYEEKRE